MISVVLCTYDRAHRLTETLRSLDRLRVPDDLAWELLIVDNNSHDDTAAVVAAYRRASANAVRYIFEPEQGHSNARNRGIREANGAILAFIDDDVTVEPRWLAQLHETYQRFDCVGVGGKIVPVWPRDKPAWLDDRARYPLMKAIVGFDLGNERCVLTTPPFGANMSFKKLAFERYGLFRTDLGRTGRNLIGGEDTEFGRRLLGNNETLIYDPGVVVYHPVERERLTRRYWQRWYFAYGRVSARRARTDGAVRRTGRSLLRSVLGSFVRWMLGLDLHRRFYYRLQFYLSLGYLYELTQAARQRAPTNSWTTGVPRPGNRAGQADRT